MSKTQQKTDRLLDEAKDAIEKGDGYYMAAADAIIAAKKADPQLSDREVGERVGKSRKWVQDLVANRHKVLAGERAPEQGVDWHRGSHATADEIEEGARKALTDPEKRRKILSGLSANDQAEVGASAFETQAARKAARNLDPQGKANLTLARTEGDEDTDQRNREKKVIHSRISQDEYYWREFKALITPKFLSAHRLLGMFEWNEERIAWMHEYGEGIKNAFNRIAAENAQMSEEDFAALLNE